MTIDPFIWIVEIEPLVIATEELTWIAFTNAPDFVTKSTDTPANTSIYNSLENPGQIERSIADTTAPSFSTGNIVIRNTGGRFDFMKDYAFDGRTIRVRRGPRQQGNFPDDYPIYYSGVIDLPEPTLEQWQFILRDTLQLTLDKVLQPTLYAGTNSGDEGVEGVPGDLKGKPKPRLYGAAFNISPPCVNTSLLIYQVSDRPIGQLAVVRDAGVPLTLGTLYTNYEDFIASTPAPGQYDAYFSDTDEGSFFMLGSSPLGIIACDAFAVTDPTDATIASIAYDILTTSAEIDPSRIDFSTVTDLNTDVPYIVGYWTDTREITIGEILSTLFKSAECYWSQRRDGTFFFGQYALPTGDPVFEYKQLNIRPDGIDQVAFNEPGRGQAIYKFTVNYAFNNTVMSATDLAGDILDSDLATANALQQEWRNATQEVETTLVIHPRATTASYDTMLFVEAEAQTHAYYLSTLYSGNPETILLTVPVEYVINVELGDVVKLTYPRYTWTDGALFQVHGLAEDYESNNATLTLWRG